jgi:cell division protein FtsL
MIRLMHILAIGALVASALYAYSIKYDTIFLAEKVAKLKSQTKREKDAIAVLRAEWQKLDRPERIQALADKHLDLPQLQVSQIVRFSDLPDRKPKVDEIGRKLEALGLGAPTATPSQSAAGEARTPSARPQ